MGARYKTVRKQFDYMHCDDFAAYLSEMAAKGWHFKLWERNLVFEKGEPADVTYAVEIFREARDSGFKPDPSVFEFSEMCEAAGWQFVDSRRKFCVLRKVSPDASPLFTPEERLQNALKEEYRIGGIIGLLFLILGFGLWLGLHVNGSLVGKVFSSEALMRDLVWWILILTQAGYYGYGLFCKKRYMKDISQGKELYIGNRKKKAVYVWIYDIILAVSVVTLIACQLSAGEMEETIYYSIALGLTVLFRYLFLRNTERSIHYFYGMMLVVVFFFVTLSPDYFYTSAKWYDFFDTKLDWTEARQELPLDVTDYREIPMKMAWLDVTKEHSVFGKHEEYILWFEEDENTDIGVVYATYESRSDKILELVWNDLLRLWGSYAPLEECTQEWEAVEAFQNEEWSDYFVRYEDCIFMLREFEGVTLDAEQIAVIRDKMKLK
ncbi:MAG: DUF2812 domain-containing protein [Lachnospiraceae bacterium]|nr:DUF2812 domain-containing protein [Lachnospiraceae bacterium]